MADQPMGWIPPSWRTPAQLALCEQVEGVGLVQPFRLIGDYREEQGRFPLWQLAEKVLGGRLPYNWQVTGSCVGAGGGNAAKTRQAVEIALGDPERYEEIFWLFTYGQSRYHAGLGGKGEGSFGHAWAKAAAEDGTFTFEEAKIALFPLVQGWYQTGRGTELEWSDGKAKRVEPWVSLGRKHPFKSLVRIRTVEELKGAIAGAKSPCTIASMFGTRTIRKEGNPAVQVAKWDDQWAHQMYIDEWWDHPDLGGIARIGNNWGPGAHPGPTQGEPPGGFYVTASTLTRILSSSDAECFALAGYEGLVVRQLDWGTI